MIDYKFGDVVLVPFPFTNQTNNKKRPAVIVSSTAYHHAHSDVIVMAITSQIQSATFADNVAIADWQGSGLLKPSVIKPIISTLEKGLVLKKLGQLGDTDRQRLQTVLGLILGNRD
jgi:mRNA interferase MazF